MRHRLLKRNRGNILIICAAIGFVILVIGLWALDVFWLHLLNAKELSAAEKVAMAAAVALNKDDSIGQMNFTLAHSRELMACLRFNEAMAERDHETLKLLAHDLAQKAHDNAAILAAERKALESERIAQSVKAAQDALSSAGSPGAARMAGVATSGASIMMDKCSFGCAKANPSGADSEDNISSSNVEPSKYFFDDTVDKMLVQYDKKFVDTTGNYYKGNCHVPLDLNFPGGGDDSDLQFPLSSLPPCINNYTSPPRLMQGSEFSKMAAFSESSSPQYIPTAVYIVLKLDVKDTKSGAGTQLMAPGIALTAGGTPPP
jgi:hypothetical protein